MRVIAGKARRIQLETVKDDNTRPTTDRIKETLFNMINNRLYDVDFLDLFSGSGGIGIEALSRGARSATFIENNRNAAKCISNNLIRTHFEEQAETKSEEKVEEKKEEKVGGRRKRAVRKAAMRKASRNKK